MDCHRQTPDLRRCPVEEVALFPSRVKELFACPECLLLTKQ
jgi:hypothetical protein